VEAKIFRLSAGSLACLVLSPPPLPLALIITCWYHLVTPTPLTTCVPAGCPNTAIITGSTVTVTQAPTITPTAPEAQTVCANAAANFTFNVAAPGATDLLATPGAGTCTVSADYSVSCTSVPAPGTSVSLVAKYGNAAAGDDCATLPVSVPLAVNSDPAITLADVKPTSMQVCPAASAGAVSFQVTTSRDAKTLTGSLVNATSGEAVTDPNVKCTAIVSATDKKVWTVSCTGVPLGSYALKVSLQSALGEFGPAAAAPWNRRPGKPLVSQQTALNLLECEQYRCMRP
jgi:hypothetical protein